MKSAIEHSSGRSPPWPPWPPAAWPAWTGPWNRSGHHQQCYGCRGGGSAYGAAQLGGAFFFLIFGEKKWWILPSGYVKIAIENGDL